jgi:hypothetical protein
VTYRVTPIYTAAFLLKEASDTRTMSTNRSLKTQRSSASKRSVI